jgi:hypothetical protein
MSGIGGKPPPPYKEQEWLVVSKALDFNLGLLKFF